MKSFFNQVNLTVTTGTTFSEKFLLLNPDKTPQDLTGCIFEGHIAKHAGAINAVESVLPCCPQYKYIPLLVGVEEALAGSYRIFMSKEVTAQLEEGKYVYSVGMTDQFENRTQVAHGLVFVSFGLQL